MTVVKPKGNHPWRASIKDHVDEAMIKRQIRELEERIKELKKKLKEKDDGR